MEKYILCDFVESQEFMEHERWNECSAYMGQDNDYHFHCVGTEEDDEFLKGWIENNI